MSDRWTRVVCPKFGHPTLSSEFEDYAFVAIVIYRHATKKINTYSIAESITRLESIHNVCIIIFSVTN